MTVKFLDEEKNSRIRSISDDAEFYVQISTKDSNQYIIMATGVVTDRELGICANQDIANACINMIYVHLSTDNKFCDLTKIQNRKE